MFNLKGIVFRGLFIGAMLALAACASSEPSKTAAANPAAPTLVATTAPTETQSKSAGWEAASISPLEAAAEVVTITPAPTSTTAPSSSPTPTLTSTPQLNVCASLAAAPATAQSGELQVAFLQEGDVFLWTEKAGAGQALTDSGDVKSVLLAPDGKWVVFERQAGTNEVEVWAINSDGTDERLLLGASRLQALGGYARALAVQAHHLSWIPGTTRLAFNTNPVYSQTEPYAADDLWTVDAATGEIQSILPHGKGGEFVYSPDGKQIALMTPDSFSLVNADGTNLRWDLLEDYQALDMGGSYFFPTLAWAPDSRSLRLAIPNPADVLSALPTLDIWDIPQNGLYPVQIAAVQAFPPSLTFSPDLRLISYITWQGDQSGRLELNLISLDTQPAQNTLYEAGGRLEFLGWAPDARHFAFWLPATGKLLLGDACGARQTLTGQLTDYGSLTWIDPERFLFIAGPAGARELWLGQVGGESRKLLDLGERVVYDFVVR